LVMVLNGPNLNLLGERQPEIYGYLTLADVEHDCRAVASDVNLDLIFHQSNREYEIIDWIHEARGTAAGIVINPAAFTHMSVAILDALNTFEGPVIEVHIGNIHMRLVGLLPGSRHLSHGVPCPLWVKSRHCPTLGLVRYGPEADIGPAQAAAHRARL